MVSKESARKIAEKYLNKGAAITIETKYMGHWIFGVIDDKDPFDNCLAVNVLTGVVSRFNPALAPKYFDEVEKQNNLDSLKKEGQ